MPFKFCIFPGYKYCGPGCSGPGAPVNAVDAACKAHDECYRFFGPSCHCDQVFLSRLYELQNPNTEEGRHARVLYNYMKLQTLFTC
ncbi:phospholipase [Pontibacillus sp. HMF3514]|uniref:phospholipase n=1 Tax=Pontibacillus sp. HMF3514 TaxID=2692425 RepID=UPI0013203C56|nr:phospholipase [Pontibacillus sp. HMF3514]QHE53574.1 phospholipase [Pontibacillus sp. HMF3514]